MADPLLSVMEQLAQLGRIIRKETSSPEDLGGEPDEPVTETTAEAELQPLL